MPMNARLLRPIASRSLTDADATAYLTAVQAADGQALEPLVRDAITAFVIGCKADGIWSAIRASCILMGARTLSGALTPLVGTAPTNENFVSADYNRKTGLAGNGANKRITQSLSGASETNHSHSYFSSSMHSDLRFVGGFNGLACILTNATVGGMNARTGGQFTHSLGPASGFHGVSRSGSNTTFRHREVSDSFTSGNDSIALGTLGVFAPIIGFYSVARLAFYHGGTDINLALLNSRIQTLYNAIGAAIP